VIAEGIIQAVRVAGVNLPVVVRLEGTNADKARALLGASGLAITVAKDVSDAATKAVRAARAGAKR
jgi:succinyl-CoA synthetase beta subunit